MRLLLVVSLLFAFASCRSTDSSPTTRDNPPVEPLQTVAVRIPERKALARDASLTAEFRAYQQVDLHAKVSGYLRRIPVDVGSRVQNGDVVAMLEAPELQAEVDEALAARRRAESDLSRTQAEVLRRDAAVALAKASAERLLGVNKAEAGLVAQQEIDSVVERRHAAEAEAAAARAQVTAASQQVEATKAAEARTRSMLEYTRVTAPFAGVVVKRYADPGSLIQSGSASNTQALLRLADTDRLRLVANVPEMLAGLVRPGAPVTVRVPALRLSFPAKISRLTGSLQQDSRTSEVEIDVSNSSRSLLPGMVADVALHVEGRGDSLTVPIQSLLNLGGNRSVLIVNDGGMLEERPIKTGVEGAADVEVVSGLDGREKLVISNRSLLRPGMHVKFKLDGAAQ